MYTLERAIRNLQGLIVLFAVAFVLLIIATASILVRAQFPAPSSEPPIQWNPATDTLTITRKDVMVCLPQEGTTVPSCRFAKWWTETVIR